MEEANRRSAVVAELLGEVSKHCLLDGKDVCSLLSTSKLINDALKETCSSCADVRLIVDVSTAAEQLRTFSLWLSDYGCLVHSIQIEYSEDVEGTDGQLVKAVLEASLPLAFRLASRSSKSFCLCELSSSVFFNPAVLQDLPAGSLTSLKLTPPELDDDVVPLNNPSCYRALASLTGLRRLVIEEAAEAQDLPVGYIAATSSLLQLTYLQLQGADAASLSRLPSSLLELNLRLKAAAADDAEGLSAPSLLDLKHLSKLTGLTVLEALDAASTFPTSLLQINTVASPGTLQALKPLRSLSRLHVSTPMGLATPPVSTLALITRLTTVTHLNLSCSSRAIHNSLPLWSQFQNLRALSLLDYERSDGQGFITPALVAGLGAAAALTSLRIGGNQMENQTAAMGSLCGSIAGLRGLQDLSINGLALRVSALSLSRLTQLKQLSLRWCRVPDMVVTALGCSLKQLCRLNLSDNTDLTDGCMPVLGQLTTLTYLGMWGLYRVTETGLMQLTGLRRLQELDMDPMLPKGLSRALPGLRAG